MAVADVITCADEEIVSGKPYELFDPEFTYKRKTVVNFTAKKLQVQLYQKGRRVYESPSVAEIKDYCKAQLDTIWDEVKRFENPHGYYVDLSKKLWDKKQELLMKSSV